jgi:hypothetical protein
MPKTSLFRSDKAAAPAPEPHGETMIQFRERAGGSTFTVRLGQISGFLADVDDSARGPYRGLGASLALMSGNRVKLAGLSVETVRDGIQAAYGDRFPAIFHELSNDTVIRLVHVSALGVGANPLVHMLGGQTFAVSAVDATALQSRLTADALLFEAAEPAEEPERVVPIDRTPMAPEWSADRSYAIHALVTHNGKLWRCAFSRGCAVVEPGTDAAKWEYVREI